MTTLNLTLLPLYRLNHQELPALPGLLAVTPPRKTARGREHDRLIVYLVLTGNATLSTAEYLQLTSQTASKFFETPGALTTAMRTAADALNHALLERNLNSTGRGQYAIGWLVLAVLRGAQCTMLQSGPTHIYMLGGEAITHTHDPALSGKGLGLSQAATSYFTQAEMQLGDRLIFSGNLPQKWEGALSQVGRDSIEAIRRRLLSLSQDDVNAVVIRAGEGAENMTVLRPALGTGSAAKEAPSAPPPATVSLPSLNKPESTSQAASLEPEEDEAPEFVPSAYAIPPQTENSGLPEIEEVLPKFPASIPRVSPTEPEAPSLREMEEPIMDEPEEPAEPRQPSEATRQVARGLVSGMQAWRRMVAALGYNLQKFLPNLLPSSGGSSASAMSSNALMIFIAVAVPKAIE